MDNFKITISNESMEINSEQPINVVDLANIFGSILVECVRSLDIPEEHLATVRGEMFDDMNLIFSRTLEEAFPEFELRPGITEEAIMALENQMITERAAALDTEVIPVEAVVEEHKNVIEFPQPSSAE